MREIHLLALYFCAPAGGKERMCVIYGSRECVYNLVWMIMRYICGRCHCATIVAARALSLISCASRECSERVCTRKFLKLIFAYLRWECFGKRGRGKMNKIARAATRASARDRIFARNSQVVKRGAVCSAVALTNEGKSFHSERFAGLCLPDKIVNFLRYESFNFGCGAKLHLARSDCSVCLRKGGKYSYDKNKLTIHVAWLWYNVCNCWVKRMLQKFFYNIKLPKVYLITFFRLV